jgi:ABC-2 type transport system permease protein
MNSFQLIWTIAKKEFRSALRQRVIILLGAIVWILLTFATITGLQKFRDAAGQKTRAASLFRHEWEEQEANPHSAAHFGTYLFKPNSFLSVYDNGLNNYLGISYRVEAHVQHEVNQSQAETTDSYLRFGELSVATVFQLLLPLFILFLTFNSVTKEKEGNTIRMLLVQGVSPSTIIWGKITGICMILLSIVVPAMLLMALPFVPGSQGNDSLSRYALFSLCYILYFVIMVSIGVVVSSIHRTSNASLVSSIGLWFLLAVLIPRLTVRSIDAAEPLPSRHQLNRDINEGYSKGMNKDGSRAERYQKYLDETLKKYKVDSVAQLPMNFDGLAMQLGEDYNSKVYEVNAQKVEDIIRRQQASLDVVGLLDPFIAMQQVSMGLTGTDYYHHLHFHKQAREYRDAFIRLLNLDLANGGSEYLSYSYKVGPDFFKKMKDFEYHPLGLRASVNDHRLSFLSLLFWMIFIFVLVMLSAKRLK